MSKLKVNTITNTSSGPVDITASDSNLLDGFGSSQYLRSDIDQTFTGALLTTYNLYATGNLKADGTSFLACGVGQPRIYFSDGRLNCVANDNSAWGVWNSRAAQYYFTDPTGSNALHYNSGRWQILNTGAAAGSSGTILTSPDDSVGSAKDVASGTYIEFAAGGRAVGCNYFVSDERYKENIGITSITKEQSANLINSIQHKQFDWNDQNPEGLAGTHQEIGYTAQNLESVHSSFSIDMSDSKKMINTNSLMIHMTHTIQYLMDEISDLKTQVAGLSTSP